MTLDVHTILTDLRAQHLGRNNRRAQTALDVPAAVWLWNACQRENAQRVLELGSGFSSWALRHWQQRAAVERNVMPDVWTIDDEAKWLETTRIELTAQGFATDRLVAFDDLRDWDPREWRPHLFFDVVFVDLDNTGTRLAHAERFVSWTKPGGLLVLDDWHMAHYREPMTRRLAALGVAVDALPETTDEWGRYMAVARKPA